LKFDIQLPHALRRLPHTGQYWLYVAFRNVWVQRWMRLGHAAKGVLYGLIGLLTLNSLRNASQETGGSETVLIKLNHYPLGRVILAVLAVGLVGYTIWRIIQAVLNLGHFGEMSVQRLIQRGGYVSSGLTYLGVAYTAARLAAGAAVEADDSVEDAVSIMFDWSLGPWILLGVSVGVVGVGLAYVYGAYSGSFIGEFRKGLHAPVRRGARLMGKIGFTARGVSFVLIGLYLAKAAYFVDDDSAGGLGQTFGQVREGAFGGIWLSAIAIGFIAYALYMIVAACYREFPDLRKNRG
jgi:hypothetical protein